MTQHPKGLILSILADAGIPPSELHPMADRIAQAYDDLNPGLTDVLDRRRPRVRFELEEVEAAS